MEMRGSPLNRVEEGKYDIVSRGWFVGDGMVHLLLRPQGDTTAKRIRYYALPRGLVLFLTEDGVRPTIPTLVAERKNREMTYTIYHSPI